VRCRRKNALAAFVLTAASLRRRALLTGEGFSPPQATVL